MKIGIDVDGTLRTYPEFFTTLGRLFRADGHEVYIITGLGKAKATEKLSEVEAIYGTEFYNALFSSAEYNESERALIGVVQENELIVGIFKQRLCRQLGVDIMFDDKATIHALIDKHGVPIFAVPKNRFE